MDCVKALMQGISWLRVWLVCALMVASKAEAELPAQLPKEQKIKSRELQVLARGTVSLFSQGTTEVCKQPETPKDRSSEKHSLLKPLTIITKRRRRKKSSKD